MTDKDPEQSEDAEQERPPIVVVDKRISSAGANAPLPSAPAEAPAPPQPPEEEMAVEEEGTMEEGRIWTPERPDGAADETPAQAEDRETEARRVAQQIVDVPSIEWIVNVAVTLANVAGAKLEAGRLEDAQPAIDALAGLVNAVGDRLAGAETPLRQTLAELQMVYAQRATGSEKESGGG
ncbi:MAG: hypothetical protein ACRDJI_03810 [Actinomycetota bacterium]